MFKIIKVTASGITSAGEDVSISKVVARRIDNRSDEYAAFDNLHHFLVCAALFVDHPYAFVFVDPDEAAAACVGTPWMVGEIGNNYEVVKIVRTANKPGPTRPVRAA